MTPTTMLPKVGETLGNQSNGRVANVGGAYTRHDTTNGVQTQAATKNNQLAWACRYALQGLAVFPCKGKKPLTEHGYLDATTDLETIGAWWARWPSANIGLPMAPNGLIGLDVDPRNGGTLAALALPAELKTWRAATGGGGQHIILVLPALADVPGSLGPGLDVKRDGYIIVAPSLHPDTGRAYHWLPGQSPWDCDPAPVPADLLARMMHHDAPQVVNAGQCDHKHADHRVQAGTVALDVVEDALKAIDPWSFGYMRWLRVLMALHSEYPGEDGRKVAVAWACGKPGEVEAHWDRHFKRNGNRTGKVGLGTLFYEAKQAGWVRPAAEDAALPWNITKADWDSCPVCRASITALLDDGSVANTRNFCHNPNCRVQHKRKMRRALAGVLAYTGIRVETVPDCVWRQWRENMHRSGRRYTSVPMPDGKRFCMVEVDAKTENMPELLTAAADAWEHKPANRNMSQERQPKPSATVETVPPKPRPKVVDRWIVTQPEQRRAVLDVLNRLGVPYERRAYGGWKTAVLDDETRDRLRQALSTVPGSISLAPTTSISYFSTTGQINAQWPDELPHREPEAVLDAVRNRYNPQSTSPLRRSRAKRAADGRKRAALNAIERQAVRGAMVNNA